MFISVPWGERERERGKGVGGEGEGEGEGAWMGFGARAIHVLFRREEILSLQNFEETPYHY